MPGGPACPFWGRMAPQPATRSLPLLVLCPESACQLWSELYMTCLMFTSFIHCIYCWLTPLLWGCVYYNCMPAAELEVGLCVGNSVQSPSFARAQSGFQLPPTWVQWRPSLCRWGPSTLSWLCHGGHMGFSFLLLKSPWKSAAPWGCQALLFSRNK